MPLVPHSPTPLGNLGHLLHHHSEDSESYDENTHFNNDSSIFTPDYNNVVDEEAAMSPTLQAHIVRKQSDNFDSSFASSSSPTSEGSIMEDGPNYIERATPDIASPDSDSFMNEKTEEPSTYDSFDPTEHYTDNSEMDDEVKDFEPTYNIYNNRRGSEASQGTKSTTSMDDDTVVDIDTNKSTDYVPLGAISTDSLQRSNSYNGIDSPRPVSPSLLKCSTPPPATMISAGDTRTSSPMSFSTSSDFNSKRASVSNITLEPPKVQQAQQQVNKNSAKQTFVGFLNSKMNSLAGKKKKGDNDLNDLTNQMGSEHERGRLNLANVNIADEDYSDEDYDPLADIDEVTLRNTRLNSTVEPVTKSEELSNPNSYNNKAVSFSTQIKEHLGAWEDDEGELEYGPPETSIREMAESENDPDKPMITSRMSSLVAENEVLPSIKKSDHPIPPSKSTRVLIKNGARPLPDPVLMSGGKLVKSSSNQKPRSSGRDTTPKSVSNSEHSRRSGSPVSRSTSPMSSSPSRSAKKSASTSNLSAGIITPVASPVKKKKVRHVQIQTKAPQVRDIGIQCNLGNNVSVAPSSTNVVYLEEKVGKQKQKITSLQGKHDKLAKEATSLKQALTAAQASHAELAAEMQVKDKRFEAERKKLYEERRKFEEERERLNELTASAFRKIKNLVAERQVSDIQIRSLQEQLYLFDKQLTE